MAKGFGGKYFSLQAITATVNATTLHNHFVRTRNCHNRRYAALDESIGDPPPDDADLLLETIEPFTPKVSRCQCHCNRFFGRRTRCVLFVSSFVPRLRFLFRHFHTDTSPPLETPPFSF